MQDTQITSEIIKKTGLKPGPTIAIFAGAHGNERTGVLALQELIPRLEIKRGTLYLAYINVPAIEQNVRMINKNINRCFYPSNIGETYEDRRARELITVLDQCEALLDLHASYDDTDEPFTACEENAMDLVTKFDVPVITTNWFNADPGGTDDYMYNAGKIGVCFECGPLSKPQQFKPLAIKTIHQFLRYYDMIDTLVTYSTSAKRIIKADRSVFRTSEDFYLDPNLRNFQALTEGQILGSQDGRDFVAQAGECVLFPHANASIGTEAFIFGREAKPHQAINNDSFK